MPTDGSQVLALGTSRQGAESMRQMVAQSPAARLAGLEMDLEEFERKALQVQPDILLLDYNPEDPAQGQVLERLKRAIPRSAVVVISEVRDPEAIIRAMRLGVREYLLQPASALDFNDAVLRLSRQAKSTGKPAGRILAVVGVKGGVGTSHFAVNAAWGLSQQMGQRVALCDFDMAGGDLATLLDVDPHLDVTAVAANFQRMDSVMLDGMMTEIAGGLRLLAAPRDPVAAEEVNAEHIARILELLTDDYALVVADLANRLDEVSLLTLDKADLIIYLVEPTLMGLRRARRMLDLSDRLGHEREKVSLVVNRDSAKGSIPHHEVQRALGREVLAWLPNDHRSIMEAGNSGRPMLQDWPRSKWSKAMVQLCPHLLNGQGEAS